MSTCLAIGPDGGRCRHRQDRSTFRIEIGLVTHHQKHSKHAQMDRSNDSLGSAHQGSDIRPAKVIVKLMLASHPDGPCPEPAKMYRCHLCQDYVGRKALISHLRNCHHIHRPDGFPFDPVHDKRILPMLLVRFVCPGMLSQPLSLKSFYVPHSSRQQDPIFSVCGLSPRIEHAHMGLALKRLHPDDRSAYHFV